MIKLSDQKPDDDFLTLTLGETMLSSLDLYGIGCFKQDFAAFSINHYFLGKDWDYLLGDGQLYWRIAHNGRGYLQPNPPDGRFWLYGKGKDDLPPWLVYCIVDDIAPYYFTNFWGPRPGAIDHLAEPDFFECTFSPESAWYRVENAGITVETELSVISSPSAAVMKVAFHNNDSIPHKLAVMPVISPHLTNPMGAAWDMPWLYQSSSYSKRDNRVFFEMRDPGGNPEQRQQLQFILDRRFSKVCLNKDPFIGRGSPANPEALHNWEDWAESSNLEAYGENMFAAFADQIILKPNKNWEFTMSLSRPDIPVKVLRNTMKNLDTELDRIADAKQERLTRIHIHTPDGVFNRYVNEYLTLQQEMVLRRGWPCRMMGVRDAAQDYTPVVAWFPEKARAMILRILESQRSDGWFLRQFSTEGRHGKHDERPYVDSGLWVWELVYEYVCQNRDFKLLDEKLPFLDQDKKTTILDHLQRLLDYYLNPENLGEHGLCKIREGDWNDSVNRAGLAGRGESVMVSCHLIYCLKQAEKLFTFTNQSNQAKVGEFAKFADNMKKHIRQHALNNKSYLNAVFADNGNWYFSAKDPDGQERFNIPANAFGMLADIFTGAEQKKLLAKIKKLRRDYGYPLFDPAIGNPPMPGLGRIGSGDLREGLAENGACYNHGCHGFLARGLAAIGAGDMFFDALEFLLPYHQEKHPVARTKTAPYAIVNVYLNAPGREGEGGDTFFSGSIATAYRNVYQSMLGVNAETEGLQITPCFPPAWPEISGRIIYAGKELRICIKRDGKKLRIFADDKELKQGFYKAK